MPRSKLQLVGAAATAPLPPALHSLCSTTCLFSLLTLTFPLYIQLHLGPNSGQGHGAYNKCYFCPPPSHTAGGGGMQDRQQQGQVMVGEYTLGDKRTAGRGHWQAKQHGVQSREGRYWGDKEEGYKCRGVGSRGESGDRHGAHKHGQTVEGQIVGVDMWQEIGHFPNHHLAPCWCFSHCSSGEDEFNMTLQKLDSSHGKW